MTSHSELSDTPSLAARLDEARGRWDQSRLQIAGLAEHFFGVARLRDLDDDEMSLLVRFLETGQYPPRPWHRGSAQHPE